MLRRYHSKCNSINRDAVIYPGVGVLGTFFKEGLKPLNLSDIPNNSITLYYYTKDVGVRSLMASPITADGVERGVVIVDHENKNHFTDEDHAFLNTAAALLGQSVFNMYKYNEHRLEHRRFLAANEIEQHLFSHNQIDQILDELTEIIPYSISCDRLTISIRDENNSGQAIIVRAAGLNSEDLTGKTFSLERKTIASILYAKNLSFYRDFAKDHHEKRYFENEPKCDNLVSFLAMPFGVTECKGMILIESRKHNAFGKSKHDLLCRLATSAGIAIERHLTLEKTKALATHDGLTGLYNHRQFQSTLTDFTLRSTRYNDPVVLVLCDIDYFKKINDTYGHPFGDTVLKGIAAKLESSIREGVDIAARYGGEEFALILYKTDHKSAVDTTERIRNKISGESFNAPGGEKVQITMSFGLAEYGKHAKQVDELIKKADKALYRAKENGRNRIEVF
ncbi:diguanylate cyclase [Chitinispirillum alkaliphilum]|nr:diguanylate cyclase [Chitinispirillum alkaliphilum]